MMVDGIANRPKPIFTKKNIIDVQAIREILLRGLKHLEEMKLEMMGDDLERTIGDSCCWKNAGIL